MSNDTKNLALLGALFVSSVAEASLPDAIRKVVVKAKHEITSTMDDKQFKLYEAAGSHDIVVNTNIDDG